jgi:hypothetical protein
VPSLKDMASRLLGVPVTNGPGSRQRAVQQLERTVGFREAGRAVKVGATTLRRGQHVTVRYQGTVVTVTITDAYDQGWGGRILTGPHQHEAIWFKASQIIKRRR